MQSNTITFTNTRSRALEVFNAIKPNKVSMYHCGPTLYDRAHLGNLCPFIYWDVMRRMFEALDYEVAQVMNFTDIGHIVADADSGDDKMVNALIKKGQKLTLKNLHQLGKEVAAIYLQDMADLNILTPHHLPYASQHIAEDIKIIAKLIEKKLAYQTSNAVYFDTKAIDDYDVFSVHGDLDSDHQRIDSNSEKRHPRDFALWKFSENSGELSSIGWDSPWGRGFPGWHIECSAMAAKYLGKSFDIHTGGIEHVAIHHTNEIAQTEHAFSSETDGPHKKMARYWLHNNHLQLNGEKISKSVGNVMYLDELDSSNLHPMDYRYLLLTSHYRSEQNLTIKSLQAARKSRKSLYKYFVELEFVQSKSVEAYYPAIELLQNDLDTAGALARIRKDLRVEKGNEVVTSMYKFVTEVLGITFADLEIDQSININFVDDSVKELLAKRKTARENKDYETSDNLRILIKEKGYFVIDDGDKQRLSKLN